MRAAVREAPEIALVLPRNWTAGAAIRLLLPAVPGAWPTRGCRIRATPLRDMLREGCCWYGQRWRQDEKKGRVPVKSKKGRHRKSVGLFGNCARSLRWRVFAARIGRPSRLGLPFCHVMLKVLTLEESSNPPLFFADKKAAAGLFATASIFLGSHKLSYRTKGAAAHASLLHNDQLVFVPRSSIVHKGTPHSTHSFKSIVTAAIAARPLSRTAT